MSLLSQLFGGGGGGALSFPSKDYIVGDLLLVGGGGGGVLSAPPAGGAGGGAGRVVTIDNVVLRIGDTGRITIGAGGTSLTTPSPSTPATAGFQGDSSYFYMGENAQSLSTIVALGGAGGTESNSNGTIGGCGAGAGTRPSPPVSAKPAGQSNDINFGSFDSSAPAAIKKFTTTFAFSDGPIVISEFISSGSPGGSLAPPSGTGAGGGGAGRDDYSSISPTNPDGSIGANTAPLGNGAGGAGYISSITGTAVTYGQGGNGCGGGVSKPAVPIPPNTGSAGHAGIAPTPAELPQGYGSDGVFVIRWPTSYPQATSVTGNDGTLPVNAVPGYYTYRWITPGTITY